MRLDDKPASRLSELKDPLDAIPSVTVKLSAKAHMEVAQQVKVTVQCALPLVAVPDVFGYAQVGSVAYEQEVTFYMQTKHVPSSLDVTVCASYNMGTSGSVPRVTEIKFR